MKTEYIVVTSNELERMVVGVNDYLDKGYKLQGGISHANNNNWNHYYSQALTIEIDEDEECQN